MKYSTYSKKLMSKYFFEFFFFFKSMKALAKAKEKVFFNPHLDPFKC